MIQKEVEALALEILAVALQIVFPKLIDDQNDDELGMCIVRAACARCVEGQGHKHSEEADGNTF